MGGVLSLFFDIAELASALSTETGISVGAILAGEAAADIEASVMGLMTIEGLGAADALAAMGLTMENFSMMYALPGMLSEAVGIGTLFQTISGASSLVAVGIKYSREEVSIVNKNISDMALQLWRPQDYYDILFPGVNHFAHYLNVIEGWASSLVHTVSRAIWDSIMRDARHQIGYASRELVVRGTTSFQDVMAKVIETSRWVLTSGPSHIYSSLSEYYRQLPGLNPAQIRDVYRRLGEPVPSRYQLEVEAREESAEVIETYSAPGGAHQRVCPDWMLPLILGLYGDVTPTFATYIHQVEKEDDKGRPSKRRRL
ncbi:VP2 [Alphapolyomavirus apaniscus]|uniref:Minor capsid protein n=1 Tax=Alphapolyomavirus apaniscus TaxID=1236391 RepID=K7QJK0_9POLY|nr:VP2 [Alphapolyomavirus apaniscus]AFU25610.1 VP2 [Alphapolyomavirus apaniscus]